MDKNNVTANDKYIVADAHNGNPIDEYDSLEEAKEAILLMESFDREVNAYHPGSYVIRHGDEVVIPEDNTTIPEDNTTIPEDNTTIPEDNTTIPEDNTTIQEKIMQKATAVIDLTPNKDFPFDYKGFMQDFRFADLLGADSIKDTYDQAFEQWKDNVDYFASLVLTLSHQGFYHHENGNDELGLIYDQLCFLAQSWGSKHFTGKDKEYYFRFLD